MIKVGTFVIIRYDPHSHTPNEIAKRYDGSESVVTRVKNYGARGTYYELEGIVSQMGVPYVFAESDLVEV